MLRSLRSPGDAPIVRQKNSTQGSDNRALPVIEEVRRIERRRRAARLFHPMLAAIRGMKNRAGSPNHPSDTRGREVDSV